MKRRSGFTLIEILVVIAIIAILASLILGAVVALRGKGPEAQTVNEIRQISLAMSKFASEHGNFYPPNRLRLCGHRNKYTLVPTPGNANLDTQSIEFLSKLFPNMGTQWSGGGIAWDGTANANIDVILEGDQVLVFVLGGIPDPAGAGKPPQGFSVNPNNPATAAGDRKKSITFEASRIVLLHGNNFPSYLDGFARDLPAAAPSPGKGFKQPYVYFGSMTKTKKENGYDPTPSGPPGTSVSPYVQNATAPVKYWNSSTFQLISAGPDGVFGGGGTVTLAPLVQKAWPGYTPAGTMDDYSNFNSSRLSVPD
jgi:prepilin-type N-terminal cleavage/methylation domain-containing protein